MIVINTQDETLIELLADQTFSLTRDYKLVRLLTGINSKYSVQVAVKCSESPEDTLFSLSMGLENEQIEVRVVSRQESNFCVFELASASEEDYNRIFTVLENSSDFKYAILQKSVPIDSPIAI